MNKPIEFIDLSTLLVIVFVANCITGLAVKLFSRIWGDDGFVNDGDMWL